MFHLILWASSYSYPQRPLHHQHTNMDNKRARKTYNCESEYVYALPRLLAHLTFLNPQPVEGSRSNVTELVRALTFALSYACSNSLLTSLSQNEFQTRANHVSNAESLINVYSSTPLLLHVATRGHVVPRPCRNRSNSRRNRDVKVEGTGAGAHRRGRVARIQVKGTCSRSCPSGAREQRRT